MPASATPTSSSGRGSGGQTIYDTLKRDLLEMALTPGEPLDEARLSRRFAISRTPVEEHDAIIAAILGCDTETADRPARDHHAQVIRQIQNFLASGVGDDIDLSVQEAVAAGLRE